MVQIPGSDTLDESKAGFDCGGEGTLVDVWLPIEIAAGRPRSWPVKRMLPMIGSPARRLLHRGAARDGSVMAGLGRFWPIRSFRRSWLRFLCAAHRRLIDRRHKVGGARACVCASEDGAGTRPITSSVMVAIGTGHVFSKGRDFAAWLGLAPRQIWTGDRANIQARQSLSARPIRAGGLGGADPAAELERYGLSPWIEAAEARCTATCWRSRSPIS